MTEDATLEDIVELMERNHVKRLPVLRGDKLAGIVTRTNLLQAVAGLTRDVPDPTADDDHIRNRIISSIEKSRQAAIVAAENVTGVTKVHDHICWVGPMAGMYLNSAEDDRALRVTQ